MKSLKWLAFRLRLLKVILATCGFNIMVILIIILLLTLMAQGAPLMVDLLSSPGNLILFWFILWGTALAYGHYPVYAYKWRKTHNAFKPTDKPGSTVWKLNSPSFLGLGIITYESSDKMDDQQDEDKDGLQVTNNAQKRLDTSFDNSRGFLGLIITLAIFYCLVFTFQKFVGSNTYVPWFLIILLSLSILYIYIYIPKSWVELALKIIFGLFVITVSINLYLATSNDYWNGAIFWSFSAALIFQAILYILFKKYRSRLRKDRFLFADHRKYLLLIAGLGWVSFFTLSYSQFYPSDINPIVILLAFFNVIYGMYVIILKHRLYYFYKALSKKGSIPNVKHPRISIFFRFIVPPTLIFLVLWTIAAGIIGNNLHQLSLVPNPAPMSLVDFRDQFEQKINFRDPHGNDTLYFIASYGGGLKANAWNLMVMDSLSQLGILESTIAISGVSGGIIGQFLFGGLEKRHENKKIISNKIEEISTYNFLSNDLAWLLGWDLLRELIIFYPDSRPDRAKKSLKVYQTMVGDHDMTKQGMQTYWNSIYDSKGYYPILIANSAGINNRRGINCSVQFPITGTTFQKTFPGAVNLLDHKDAPAKSLSYLGAASTSNRFPFLSPAAKVPEKGHYVDGGYFENSGMFSLLNLYETLKKDTTWSNVFRERPVSFIQISNHKSTFIRQTVPDSLIQIEKMDEGGEIFQVLQTKASTEFLPYYFEQKIQFVDSITINFISLPYRFTLKDIKNEYKARSLTCQSKEVLKSIIDENNNHIDTLYMDAGYSSWDAIEPATARLLSYPAVNYMKMVLKHDANVVSY